MVSAANLAAPSARRQHDSAAAEMALRGGTRSQRAARLAELLGQDPGRLQQFSEADPVSPQSPLPQPQSPVPQPQPAARAMVMACWRGELAAVEQQLQQAVDLRVVRVHSNDKARWPIRTSIFGERTTHQS